MSKNILYIGNKLSQKDRSVTSIETFGQLLAKESYNLKFASSKKSQVWRLLDMCYTTIRHRSWADYILIDTYSTSAFWYSYVVSKMAQVYKIKHIPILRGGNLPHRLQKNPKLCRQLFGSAWVNVAPSNYLLEAFQYHGFKNLQYIPNSIELSKYNFQVRKKARPKLLYVRSFAYIYNPILALKVVKELQTDFSGIHLSMVGPFKDTSIKECKAFAEKYQLPVTFTGKMQKEEWLAYAKDFDIFINTTNIDNTPVSIIEAMALGLPIVTTNVGGIPYLLAEDEAMLVPPNDVTAMSEAIKQLLSSPAQVEALSLKGRKKVEAFDWEVVKHQWLKILNG